jgi:DNA topoisomerase-6 subunit B
MAAQQREISVAEFFSKNRHLLGFDNPRKALLTTVKEGVDNSLDACEEAEILPSVRVEIRPSETTNGNGADRFVVAIEDNGPGIVKAQIPRIFGKLLYGSKFHRLKAQRGQQGIGISAAGMYGQLTTGKAVRIISKIGEKKPAHLYEIHVDTRTNRPEILREEVVEWHQTSGTRVEIELEGRYQRGARSVDEYLRQVAIANPHVEIVYEAPDGQEVRYERGTAELPEPSKEIRPHPHGIELGILIKMMKETKARQLRAFLHQDFSRVSPRVASEICKSAGLGEKAWITRIAREEADRLYRAISETKLRAPPTDCVPPIGEETLMAGLMKECEADFYTAATRPPAVYRGNPFVVEAAMAYGGSLPGDEPVALMRFANRVPLLYQQGACAINKAVASTAWRPYGVQQPKGSLPIGPVLLVVHLASVWVPFTSESKEAVAHYPEILKEIRLAVQACGRQMGRFIKRRKRAAEAERKRSYIEKYIPHIAIALREILGFTEKEEETTVEELRGILERSRK